MHFASMESPMKTKSVSMPASYAFTGKGREFEVKQMYGAWFACEMRKRRRQRSQRLLQQDRCGGCGDRTG